MDLPLRRFADTVVLAPAGRIDHGSAERFKDALRPHLTRCATGQDQLVLDLSGVDYISSAGLRVLMLARKQAKVSTRPSSVIRAAARGVSSTRSVPACVTESAPVFPS